MNKSIIIECRIIKVSKDYVTFEFPKCIKFSDDVKKCYISDISFMEGSLSDG